MKKFFIMVLLLIIVFIILCGIVFVLKNNTVVIAMCGPRGNYTYYFNLNMSGELYSVGGTRQPTKITTDKNWIHERGIDTRLSIGDTRRVFKKVNEIYNLYSHIQTDLVFTDSWEVIIIYKDEILRRFPYPYPKPHEHVSGPQIQELVDIMVEVAPFEICWDSAGIW